MTKNESDTLKIRGTVIPQWLVTILASLVTSLIVGYFTLQASVQPIYIQISATQTAQALPTNVPIPTVVNQQIATAQPANTSGINTHKPQSTSFGENFAALIKRYYLFLIIWLLIALANKQQRLTLGEQLSMLFSKPSIFKRDDTKPIIPYPRAFYENIVTALSTIPSSHVSQTIKSGLINYIKTKVQSQPFAFFNYSIRLVLFLGFLWGTAIATIGSLESMLLISNIPEWLARYDIAITFGTILAIVISVWILGESNALMSKDFNKNNPVWGKIVKLLSLSLFASSILVMVTLAITRLYYIGIFPYSYETTIKQIVSIIVAGVVPANNLIASILLMVDALVGLAIVVVSLILVLVYFVEYAFVVITSIFVFILDITSRLLIAYIYVTSFLLITPIDSMLAVLKSSLSKNAT